MPERSIDLTKLFPVQARPARIPLLSALERRAYQAAWRIMQEPQRESLPFNSLACASARRSRHIDYIAEIIKEEMSRS